MSAALAKRSAAELVLLAGQIRAEVEAGDREVEAGLRAGMPHYIRAGELLTEAKTKVKHGEWLSWIAANFPGAETTARNYMRLAANRQRVADFSSVREALAELAEPRPGQRPEGGSPVEHLANEATWPPQAKRASYGLGESEPSRDATDLKIEQALDRMPPPRPARDKLLKAGMDAWDAFMQMYDEPLSSQDRHAVAVWVRKVREIADAFDSLTSGAVPDTIPTSFMDEVGR